MPRKPIRIKSVTPEALVKLDVSYIEARLNGVKAAEALSRYRPQDYERAADEAYARKVDLSQHLRSVIRRVDKDVSERLAFEARRRGLHGTARGLRMLPRLDIGDVETVALDHSPELPVARSKPSKRRRPSLDELRDQFPDFSDEELREYRDDRFPPSDYADDPPAPAPSPALGVASPLITPKFIPVPRQKSRKQRVVKLARDCLSRLVKPRPPSTEDYMQAWLPPKMAAILAQNRILTVHQLMVRVSQSEHWYRGLKAVGRTKAMLLEEWLRNHRLMPSREVRRAPEKTAVAERRPPLPCPAELPLAPSPDPAELALALAPPPGNTDLNGEQGKHRLPLEKALISATNDMEAIQVWLRTLRSPNTRRAYRKETVRLVLWSTMVRGKAMSSLDVEDCTAYTQFLRDIPEDWRCEPENRTSELLSVKWRPFGSPGDKPVKAGDREGLSESSIAFAVTVLKRLFTWLGDMRYLAGNPWKGLAAADRGVVRRINAAGRHLPSYLADEVLRRVGTVDEAGPDAIFQSRRRLLCSLLFEAGLRRHEVAKLTYSCVSYLGRHMREGATRYELRFTGKGDAERRVPVTPSMLEWMKADLRTRGFSPEPTWPENGNVPLIGRFKGADGCVTPEVIYQDCRAALRWVADQLKAEGETDGAQKLMDATTHWARHTFATTVYKATPVLEVVQSLLGHADIRTTQVYAHVDEQVRAAAVAKAGIGRQRPAEDPQTGDSSVTGI